ATRSRLGTDWNVHIMAGQRLTPTQQTSKSPVTNNSKIYFPYFQSFAFFIKKAPQPRRVILQSGGSNLCLTTLVPKRKQMRQGRTEKTLAALSPKKARPARA